jgi:hypothetical protein
MVDSEVNTVFVWKFARSFRLLYCNITKLILI